MCIQTSKFSLDGRQVCFEYVDTYTDLIFAVHTSNVLENAVSRLIFVLRPVLTYECMQHTYFEIRSRGYKTFFMLNSAEHDFFLCK